ncbi:recombinase family protein [Paenibacillus puerhi]|uniref:recombinase family protein n=1 Tax=Paenibacillus puerhi TaxID=2692622 RepID=UPI001358D5FD|nr:recombinase family protein [Paenibacillus puerhi]
MTKLKAVLYARINDREQTQAKHRLEFQIEVLRKYAKQHEIEIIEEFIDDKDSNITGWPQMSRLLSDSNHGKFDVVIVHVLDRFTDELIETFETIQSLERDNIELNFLINELDLRTTFGKTMLQVIYSLTDLEEQALARNCS